MKFQSIALKDIDQVIIALKPLLENYHCFAFKAPMGSGKTTFIAALLQHLGVNETIASPTFGYVKEYTAAVGTIYHFDVYRLDNELEAYDIGMDEYLDSGNVCLIEWPEKIENLLPENTVWISIHVEKDNSRTFEIKL
ncbi:MAG: tRNA (adenosine(37)-N6)-threonylcarbamoyltransferase complex ATPase subunit type 1 TsaE [Lishizhenia sp.]